MKKEKGLPIGRYTSQPLANFAISYLDHIAKETLRAKGYFRYCDDILALFKNKDEAIHFLKKIDRLSLDAGLLIKHNAIIARLGDGRSHKRKRKRMRSHKVSK